VTLIPVTTSRRHERTAAPRQESALHPVLARQQSECSAVRLVLVTLDSAEFVVMTERPVAAEQQRGVVAPCCVQVPLPTRFFTVSGRSARSDLARAHFGCAVLSTSLGRESRR
jgi:hypothetical protein